MDVLAALYPCGSITGAPKLRAIAALEAGDIDRAAALFVTDCYWRDLVSFTWNIRTLEGPDQVAAMLRAQLGHIRPTGWHLDDTEVPGEEDGIITAWFRFETKVGRGQGLVRLRDGAAMVFSNRSSPDVALHDAVLASAKSGIGIEDVLEAGELPRPAAPPEAMPIAFADTPPQGDAGHR